MLVLRYCRVPFFDLSARHYPVTNSLSEMDFIETLIVLPCQYTRWIDRMGGRKSQMDTGRSETSTRPFGTPRHQFRRSCQRSHALAEKCVLEPDDCQMLLICALLPCAPRRLQVPPPGPPAGADGPTCRGLVISDRSVSHVHRRVGTEGISSGSNFYCSSLRPRLH